MITYSIFSRGRYFSLVLTATLAALLTLPALAHTQGRGRGGALPTPVIRPIDRQVVLDQDDMTWDHYRPIPGVTWADSTNPSVRTIRIAMLLADFEEHPFVMTMPRHSDPFGNPQIDPVTRDAIPQFYADFWNKPQEINHWRSVHEYWMELSHGRIGVEMVPFGPYRMGQKYATNNGALDAAWQADAGANIRQDFDLVMRIYAGYDETTVWQEFGEMKFQTREEVTPDFCNPDPPQQCWQNTRYIDWTSWLAARYLWSNSSITMGESSGSIRHEISHAAFRIGDNNNNPYVTPYRRVGAGPWDVMDRGSFNGPGGPHRRWLIPVTEGGAAPAGLLLRNRIYFAFTDEAQVLDLSRTGLAQSGLAVGRVTARAVHPLADELTGIAVRLDGELPHDRTPWDDPALNPLSQGQPTYNNYTIDAVQRIGYDSFSPSHGVLIAKNKDPGTPSGAGGPNSFALFNWVIDANPQDIQVVDFRRPNGEVVMRTIADYRQLNDATFHAGLNSGSQYEYVDVHNRLHFYVVDLHNSPEGILSYTVAVRSLDGAGPHQRGVALAPPTTGPQDGRVEFRLTNTGRAVETSPALHNVDARRHLNADVYRLSVTVEGSGWSAQILNGLAAVPFGETQTVPVWVWPTNSEAAATVTVTLRAASESDPTRTVTTSYTVQR